MNKRHTICRYPNRRLYDVQLSRYVTLADLRQMVLDDIDFSVRDKLTAEDITGNTLLNIISEEARRNPGALKIDSLRSVIVRQQAHAAHPASVSLNNNNQQTAAEQQPARSPSQAS